MIVGEVWLSEAVGLAPVPEKDCDPPVSASVDCVSDPVGCGVVATSVAELPVSPVGEAVSEAGLVALSVASTLFATVLATVDKASERFSFEVELSVAEAVAAVSPVSPVAVGCVAAAAVSLLELSASDNALASASVALAVLEGEVVFVSTCLLISLGK